VEAERHCRLPLSISTTPWHYVQTRANLTVLEPFAGRPA
jgi:hypothetical protein